jgi:hypothetical protein
LFVRLYGQTKASVGYAECLCTNPPQKLLTSPVGPASTPGRSTSPRPSLRCLGLARKDDLLLRPGLAHESQWRLPAHASRRDSPQAEAVSLAVAASDGAVEANDAVVSALTDRRRKRRIYDERSTTLSLLEGNGDEPLWNVERR